MVVQTSFQKRMLYVTSFSDS